MTETYFIRFHSLSFTFIHFHSLSFTFIYFHSLSFTFIHQVLVVLKLILFPSVPNCFGTAAAKIWVKFHLGTNIHLAFSNFFKCKNDPTSCACVRFAKHSVDVRARKKSFSFGKSVTKKKHARSTMERTYVIDICLFL